jgi:outer membrane biosynthesis protein TonB
MKRCPQCEFIYEDDQSLCDMDGVLLVFDSRALPNMHALTTVPSKAQSKRNRAVPAFATLILALVLGMVYFVSTNRKAAQNVPTPAIVESAANPAPAESPVQVSAPEPEPQPAVEEPKAATTKAAVPVKKVSAKASTSLQTKPATVEKKDDSKVGSILKKTGRILKKPFKF